MRRNGQHGPALVLTVVFTLLGATAFTTAGGASEGQSVIRSKKGGVQPAAFDLVRTKVRRVGDKFVFSQRLAARAGSVRPEATGAFAGSQVLSYVWPTSLDPAVVGFPARAGILALAATSHQDFDDTPLVDENRDGNKANDGRRWHSHWVVLVPDPTRPDGALKVQDIAPGAKPALPATWPGVPIMIDSPNHRTKLTGRTVRVNVPISAAKFPAEFRFDGVTAGLRVNADMHDPLLRVENVFDIASGTLTLPGVARR